MKSLALMHRHKGVLPWKHSKDEAKTDAVVNGDESRQYVYCEQEIAKISPSFVRRTANSIFIQKSPVFLGSRCLGARFVHERFLKSKVAEDRTMSCKDAHC